jgi:hypothetical protein
VAATVELDVSGHMRELAGIDGGREPPAPALLISGLVLQLPLAMVVLARLLARPASRIANITVAIAVSIGLLATWPKDGDDLVFGAFQLAGLAGIALVSLRWRPEQQSGERADHPLASGSGAGAAGAGRRTSPPAVR